MKNRLGHFPMCFIYLLIFILLKYTAKHSPNFVNLASRNTLNETVWSCKDQRMQAKEENQQNHYI